MLILLQQMVILFALMVVGYVLAKKEIIDPSVSKKLSFIILNVSNPALILKSGVTVEIEPAMLGRLALYAAGMYACLLGLAFLVPVVLRVKKEQVGAYRLMTVFSNIGFMGIPLATVLYGQLAVLYLAIFNMAFNILIYSFGMSQIGGEKFTVRKLINIGTVTALVAVCCALFQVQFPEMVTGFLGHLGNLTAPLSMMVIGASFVGLNGKQLFGDLRLNLFAGIKLLVIPGIGLVVLQFLGFSGVLLGVFLILLSTPVASMTAMLTQQYDGDYETTSKGVALTTLLSVLTMPLISSLIR